MKEIISIVFLYISCQIVNGQFLKTTVFLADSNFIVYNADINFKRIEVYSKNFDLIKTINDHWLIDLYDNNYFILKNIKSHKFGLINNQGKLMLPVIYDSIFQNMSDDLSLTVKHKDTYYCYFNNQLLNSNVKKYSHNNLFYTVYFDSMNIQLNNKKVTIKNNNLYTFNKLFYLYTVSNFAIVTENYDKKYAIKRIKNFGIEQNNKIDYLLNNNRVWHTKNFILVRKGKKLILIDSNGNISTYNKSNKFYNLWNTDVLVITKRNFRKYLCVDFLNRDTQIIIGQFNYDFNPANMSITYFKKDALVIKYLINKKEEQIPITCNNCSNFLLEDKIMVRLYNNGRKQLIDIVTNTPYIFKLDGVEFEATDFEYGFESEILQIFVGDNFYGYNLKKSKFIYKYDAFFQKLEKVKE